MASASTAQNISPTIVETRITLNGSAVSPAINGDRLVYQDYQNGIHIYMYNLSTSKKTQITTNESIQWSPAIYGDRIVWTDERDGHEEIYMYNLSTSKETRITNTPLKNNQSPYQLGKIYPAIYEDRIVWFDFRDGNRAIYMYNLSTSKETQITNIKSDRKRPAIYGDRIVWSDGSNGKFDIYMYNLFTQKETLIATSKSDQLEPVIYDDRIVWQDDLNGDGYDIYMYNLSTSKETRITTSGSAYNPSIYGDMIVWEDSRNPTETNNTIDGMFSPPVTPALSDVYMYDLSTSKEYRITTNPSVNAMSRSSIYGDRIVWQGFNGSEKPDIYMATLSYPPVAVFSASPTSGNAPMKVNFTDKSTGSPTSWNWNFGDGANSTQQNPEHTYSTEGNYTVNLTVCKADGVIDTKTSEINVQSAPHTTPGGFNFFIFVMIVLYLCKKSTRN
jgi:beta propeller repeat protein